MPGQGIFVRAGHDIEPDGEARAENADAILLGAIGLPGIRLDDGTEISPHLRLRDRLGLYAGVRPVRAWPTARKFLPQTKPAALILSSSARALKDCSILRLCITEVMLLIMFG